MQHRSRSPVALWRSSDALQGQATQFDRTEGRARLSHPGNAGRQQPKRRYFRRLDHVFDGFGRQDVAERTQPVHVGDTVCCYTAVKRLGRTSITLDVEVWVLRQGQGARIKVTDAEFTFVAVHEDGSPRQLTSTSPRASAAARPRTPPPQPPAKGRGLRAAGGTLATLGIVKRIPYRSAAVTRRKRV